MTLPGLVLILHVILTSTDAKIAADHCDDCNENEPWRPLFRPSQIIHSEFPEHARHRSLEQRQYKVHEQYTSQEQVQNPVRKQYNSQEQGHYPINQQLQSQEQSQRPNRPKFQSQEQGQYPVRKQYNSQEQVHYPIHQQIQSQEQSQRPIRPKLQSQEQGQFPVRKQYNSQEQGHYPIHQQLQSQEQSQHPIRPKLQSQEQGQFPVRKQYNSQEQGHYPIHQQLQSQEPNSQQYKSQEQGQYPIREQFNSQEQDQYQRQGLSSQEHVQHNSQEQVGNRERHAVILTGSREATGIDSRVRTYSGQGKHRLEWDHYGDVSRVTTSAYNSLERTGADHRSEESEGPPAPPNSEENHSGSAHVGIPGTISGEAPEHDFSAKSQEGSFFNEGSFFDEKLTSPSDRFPGDFDISKEAAFSDEGHQSSNSIELINSHEGFGLSKKPVATSYSAISSIFTRSRPVTARPKDLLHPEINYNDVTDYIRSQIKRPVSHSQFFNGRNMTKQYLVHEVPQEDPGILRIDHVTPLPRFVPMDHPVYRYVKGRGSVAPLSRSSTMRWQDVPPVLRDKFPFKNLQPHATVQNHQSLIHHVVPTKDPFDSFWKESKKIETSKLPSLGQHLYYIKKKPGPIDFMKLGKRPGQDMVYIIKRRKIS